MRIIVCGSREWTDRATIRLWVGKLPPGSIVAHGACRGADTIAGEEAHAAGFEVHPYPVDAAVDGPWPAAGPRRNARMLAAVKPDAVLAFTWTLRREDRPASFTGTGEMVLRALAMGVRCTLVPPADRPRVLLSDGV